MVCQICFQPKRKVRFQTSRLNICQWCITELCDTELSPNQVITFQRLSFQEQRRKQIEHEIAWQGGRKSPPPLIDIAKLAQVDGLALLEARRHEGFISSLYRSLVDDSLRQAQARDIATSLRDRIIASHHEALGRHTAEQRELESNLSELHLKLLGVVNAAVQDVNEYVAASLSPCPTKSKEARLLRAHALNLINPEREQLERPVDTEYEEIKRSVRREDEFKCVCCGRSFSKIELHVHHIIPLFKFGTNNNRNLVTLCYPCHNKQHPEFQVTRNFPIRRAPAGGRVVPASRSTPPAPKNAFAQKGKLPKSRKGWMDCPDCLSSIQLETEPSTVCLECGWAENEQV